MIRGAPTVPAVSHLLFANDCIIFSRASLQDAAAIQHALKLYEKASGQKVNLNKTKISFS